MQVNLTPVGARLFLGVPLSELAGGVVPLRDLLPRQQATLAEELAGLRDWDARLDRVERLLLERITASRRSVDIVAWAVRRIEGAGGAVDMRELSRQLGYSQKHVITLFHEQVGVAPKLFARLVRFERLLQRLRAGDGVSWAQLASELGYYDQSHLTRDVREFAGTTPTRVRAELVDLEGLPVAETDALRRAPRSQPLSSSARPRGDSR